ncbi:hypothetical protein [Gaetbulibacter saemankumensis]|uniref:hypothetical protein n=1 Tax=Gaetbulibacter saemankumensis TaxID=311208 RepID=UPI0004831869|nr:hypothetical protein [Gaetbulibacter saemankumensis]
MKALFVLLLLSQTLFSQSLENLQGQYLCEADSFFHLYEFNKNTVKVTLNFKDLFIVKHTIFYSTFLKSKNKDSLHVIKQNHEIERLTPLNLKDDKSSYAPYNSNNTDKDCCHLWVLEKCEEEKLFIKIIPFHDTMFKRKYKSDSNLIRHITLTPIKN